MHTHTYTLEYYLAIESIDLIKHATTCMNLKTMPDNRSQIVKGYIFYDAIYMKCMEKAQL